MLRILRWIFFGDAHNHKWKTIKESQCTSGDDGGQWTRYYCVCEVCGKHRKFD